MSIGKEIERLRKNRGYRNLTQLAEKSKVSLTTLSRIENNVQMPTPETLKRLAPSLGVPLHELFEICGFTIESPLERELDLTSQEIKLIMSLRDYQDMRAYILNNPEDTLSKANQTYEIWKSANLENRSKSSGGNIS